MQLYRKSDKRAVMDKSGYLMQYDCLTGNEYKLWYIASRLSSLIEINRVTGEAKELFSLKKEGQYRSLVKNKDQLLLIPAKKGRLWIYDIKDGKTMSYSIPNEIFQEALNWSAKYIKLENHIYFSWASPLIVKYDLLNNQWTVLKEWRKLLFGGDQHENWFPNETFFHDGFLYFQIGTSRTILKLNPKNDEFSILSLYLPKQVVSIDNTRYSNGELWMECKNDNGTVSIYRCSEWNDCICERIIDLRINMSVSGEARVFSIIEAIGDKLLLLPGNYDKAYLLDIEKRKLCVSDDYPSVSCDKLIPNWFSAFNYYKGIKLGNQLITIHSWTHQLVEINEDESGVKKIPLFFSDEVLNRIVKREFDNIAMNNEGVLGLSDFIHYLCSD